METNQISLPVIIMKEGKWFVASCPTLDIATQGETEQEAKENMEDLIDEYLNDPDTQKPEIQTITSLSFITTKIPEKEGIRWEGSNQFLQQK